MSVDAVRTVYADLPPAKPNGHCAYCMLDRESPLQDYVFVVLPSVDGIFFNYDWDVKDILVNELPKKYGSLSSVSDYMWKQHSIQHMRSSAVTPFIALLKEIEQLGKKVGVVIGGAWAEVGTTEQICTEMFRSQPFGEMVVGRLPSGYCYDPELEKIKDSGLRTNFMRKVTDRDNQVMEWTKGHSAAAYVCFSEGLYQAGRFGDKIVRIEGNSLSEGDCKKALEAVKRQLGSL